MLASSPRLAEYINESFKKTPTRSLPHLQRLFLDILSQEIAKSFFQMAKSHLLTVSDIDPYLDSSYCLINSIVISQISIGSFDIDEATLVFIGKCLMLSKKIHIIEFYKNIFGHVKHKTESKVPKEWCSYLFTEETDTRILAQLKRDIRNESFRRLEKFISPRCRQIMRNFSTPNNKLPKVIRRYLSEVAFIEIAKEQQIPICFHVLKTRYDQQMVKKIESTLNIFVYEKSLGRFERIADGLESIRVDGSVVGMKNIWYEGSEAGLNYGDDFLNRFDLEEYVGTWRGHVEIRELFVEASNVNNFPGCYEYFKFKRSLKKNTVHDYQDILKLSFMYVTHVYPSTIGVEQKLSHRLNTTHWNPVRISSRVKIVEGKFHNRWHWESARISHPVLSLAKKIRFNLLIDSLAERVADNYFKFSKERGYLDVSEIDPLVGDTSCQVRTAVLVCIGFLAKASRDISAFDPDLVNRKTKIFLGKCILLSQKVSFDDIIQSVISPVRQKTPNYVPVEWTRHLGIKEKNLHESKMVFARLKEDVAKQSLDRLVVLVKMLKPTILRKNLAKYLASSNRDVSILGIEMAPLYLTELALIEIAKERRIPVAFHVLNIRYRDEYIEFIKWDLMFMRFDKHSNRFEMISIEELKPWRLVIGMENIWYEGSDPGFNYGPDFMQNLFNMENFIQTWNGHPELSQHLTDVKEKFLTRVGFGVRNGFDFPGSVEYLGLKSLLGDESGKCELLERVTKSSFLYLSHIYPSTVSTEDSYSARLNSHDWQPVRIESKSVKFADNCSQNQRYWTF